MKEVICIICPKGCNIQVDEANGYSVTGNTCPRGEEYARAEVSNPVRIVTSSIELTDSGTRCPVKTAQPIPKGCIFQVIEAIKAVNIAGPVTMGQVIINNVCGTGIDVVASASRK